MKGLERLDEMVFRVFEGVATGKDVTAEDIEYAARDLYPRHADLIILVIQNKPEFMELWGRRPTIEEMHLAVVEHLPRNYTHKQLQETAQQLFPDHWKDITSREK